MKPAVSTSLGLGLVVVVVIIMTSLNNAPLEASHPRLEDPKPVAVEPSMHEFMEYYFQPVYRRLKVSMAQEPENNRQWRELKSDALILAESGNLLISREVEGDKELWDGISVEVRTEGQKFYEALKAKNFTDAQTHYESMLNKCNACHKEFADGKHQLTK